jgi:uncharacterized SAM-binding protein YcdF (DUF218 family)
MSSTFFFASKLLSEFIYPFNLAVVCLLASWWLVGRQRWRWAWRLQTLGLLLLLVPATGHMSEWLLASLEGVHPPKRAADYPAADAIVVLGGTSAPVVPPRLEAEEMNGARLQMAARLYKAGKAPTVIVSGGPYRLPDGTFGAEARDMAAVLRAFGVPDAAIRIEAESRNTYENARFVARELVLGRRQRVLLVTSAFHMPRAVAHFQKEGVDAIPAPSSFLSGSHWGPIGGCVPDPARLANTQLAVKEYVGRFVYWLLGKA